MKKTILTIVAVYASFLAGIALHYLYVKYDSKSNNVAQQCNITKNYCSNTKDLHLEDFDVLLVTVGSPRRVFHVNKLQNRIEEYEQGQVIYSMDSQNLHAQVVDFSSVKVEQNKVAGNNLEYSVSGEFTLGKDSVTVSVPQLYLGMVIRAMPLQAKYAGSTPTASAKVSINGVEYPAYAAMTVGYFTQYLPVDIDLQKVTTKWAMYFDSNWNFYHLDYSDVQNPTPTYYSHKFLASVSAEKGVVEYLKQVRVVSAENNYSVFFDSNSPKNLNLQSIEEISPYRKTSMHLVKGSDGGIGVFLDLDFRRSR